MACLVVDDPTGVLRIAPSAPAVDPAALGPAPPGALDFIKTGVAEVVRSELPQHQQLVSPHGALQQWRRRSWHVSAEGWRWRTSVALRAREVRDLTQSGYGGTFCEGED